MSNFKIPHISPFRFVKNHGIHFNDTWACRQIKSFERPMYYKQKWIRSNKTSLQIESSIEPQPLKLLNPTGSTVKSFNWGMAFDGVTYKIWEVEFDVSDTPEGIYFLYQQVSILDVNWEAISEPIHSKDSWPGTLTFRYRNSYNDFDVAWSTGIIMLFTCEAGLVEPEFKMNRAAHVSQNNNVTTLSGSPSEVYKLLIGNAPGVAQWIYQLMSYIFICDYIDVQGRLLQAAPDAEWEPNRAKGNSAVGLSLDVVPAINQMSLEFSDTSPLAPGIVAAYNIETDFFGGGTVVPIIDVEQNS